MTKLDLSLAGSDQLNPDLHGHPSPIVLRLMELKPPVAFHNETFGGRSSSSCSNACRATWASTC